MAITARMAKATAEWRTAKYLHRAAVQAFGAAVDAHRDDEVWTDALRAEIAELHDAMLAARAVSIAADRKVQTAELYDRQEHIHGVKQEVA
jgi:predicted deacylase